jgi:hypothetical protein
MTEQPLQDFLWHPHFPMPLQRQRLQMLLPLQMLQTPQRNHLHQMNQLPQMNLMNQMYPMNLWK